MFSIEFAYALGAAAVLAYILYKSPGLWLALLAVLGVISGGFALPIAAGIGSAFVLWLGWIMATE